jgi:hypothetical protein
MKGRQALIAALVLALSGSIAWPSSLSQKKSANGTKRNVKYRFETEPRTAFSNEWASVRDPKLYLRTSNLYALAVFKTSGGNAQLGLATSKDLGDSFEPPVMISEATSSVSSHGENSPTLGFNGMEFYALWEQNRGEGGGSDLMFARSLRFGRSFEKPIRVTDKTTPTSNGFSYMAVAPNGDIYAVWLDGRDRQSSEHGSHGGSHGSSAVYLAKSTDKGASFGKNIRVASSVCPCCRPTLAFGPANQLFVAWRTVYDGDIRDIVVTTSTDGGATFGQPVRVAVDNWKINGCPHSGPSMSVKDRRLYISWFSEGDSSNSGVRLSWSDDYGKSFGPPVIASNGVVDANHPMLSLSEDGLLMITFQGRDADEKESWGALRPYVVEVSDSAAVSRPIALSGNKKSISYPAIVAGTVGRVFVAWTEGTEKGATVFLSRGRREVLDKGEF